MPKSTVRLTASSSASRPGTIRTASDGNVVFPFAVNTLRMFALFGEAPETIVVSVGYPAQYFRETIALRWRDLTPTREEAVDQEQSARLGVELRSGGAPAFLRFLRDEAIPFVDAT